MTQDVMATCVFSACSDRFHEVTYPYRANKINVYVMALDCQFETFVFHFFEVYDAPIILAAPSLLTDTLDEPELLFELADTLLCCDEIKNTGLCYPLNLFKVIPDVPDCRRLVRELYAVNPAAVCHIQLLDEKGELRPATDTLFSKDCLM